jgi:hypothetical protein
MAKRSNNSKTGRDALYLAALSLLPHVFDVKSFEASKEEWEQLEEAFAKCYLIATYTRKMFTKLLDDPQDYLKQLEDEASTSFGRIQ